MKRRTLLKSLGSLAALLPLRRVRLFAQATVFQIDRAPMLEAIAAAVLPESLGRRGTDEVATMFGRWLTDYRAGVTMDHGYGMTRIQRTGPLPFDRYAQQIDELEGAAGRGAGGFASLSVAGRRAIIADALRTANLDAMPQRPNGQHIVSDLMTFYFRSSEANDLCHRASVQRYACRGLGDASSPPPPL